MTLNRNLMSGKDDWRMLTARRISAGVMGSNGWRDIVKGVFKSVCIRKKGYMKGVQKTKEQELKRGNQRGFDVEKEHTFA